MVSVCVWGGGKELGAKTKNTVEKVTAPVYGNSAVDGKSITYLLVFLAN